MQKVIMLLLWNSSTIHFPFLLWQPFPQVGIQLRKESGVVPRAKGRSSLICLCPLPGRGREVVMLKG